MNLVIGQDEIITKWVSEHCGNIDFGLSAAIGIAHNGALIGGVVYNQYIKSPDGAPVSIEISIYTTTERWCTRSNIQTFFQYPFIQLGVKRLQSTCSVDNHRSRKFLEKIGFIFEGIGRDAWPLGGDCAVYSMLKHECKWIK